MVLFRCTAIVALPADVYFTERDTDAFRRLQEKVNTIREGRCGDGVPVYGVGFKTGRLGDSRCLARKCNEAYGTRCHSAKCAEIHTDGVKEAIPSRRFRFRGRTGIS